MSRLLRGMWLHSALIISNTVLQVPSGQRVKDKNKKRPPFYGAFWIDYQSQAAGLIVTRLKQVGIGTWLDTLCMQKMHMAFKLGEDILYHLRLRIAH